MTTRQPKLNFLSVTLLLSVAAAASGQTTQPNTRPDGDPPMKAELLDVHKIWDKAPHNAFVGLARWKDQFWCAFREGRGHVSTDGRIRILTSGDGKDWASAALIAWPDGDPAMEGAAKDGPDLRDAQLAVTPDGRLGLIGGIAARHKDGAQAPTGSFACFTADGKTWTKPVIVSKPGRWLWRVTWQDGKAWGVAYPKGEGESSWLMVSGDGLEFEPVTRELLSPPGRPTEAALRFADDGTLYCLHRRDDEAPARRSAKLGVALPPYKDWTFHDLGQYLGGPNFIRTSHGWVAGGRLLDKGARTALLQLDVEAGSMHKILTLPSGGDCSYPGLAWHDDVLWVVYYSSHEKKTSIYCARIKLSTGG